MASCYAHRQPSWRTALDDDDDDEAWCGKTTPVYKIASAGEIFGVIGMNAERIARRFLRTLQHLFETVC